MSDLKASDLDLEQQAKLDKELAWCIRKLYTKLEHARKDDKKVNEIIACINILKNPTELIIKKRQVMFKMLGDYRSKIKAEEAKKSSSKDEIKVKFMSDGSKEIKNSKYLKKSKAHDLECVDKKFHTLSLNEKSAKEIGENYFQMEAMKESSDDEDELPQSSQPNPFSFKNFQSSLKNDIEQSDEYKKKPDISPDNPYSFFQEDPNFELPDIDSAVSDREELEDLPPVDNVPIEFELQDPHKIDIFTNDADDVEQKFFDSKELIARQRNKISKLEKRVKELESKEESEAKTLELLVQQVEKNLEKTTARAVEAERNLEILKQESVQMKHQIKLLKNENKILKNGNNKNLFLTINKISSELNTAALSAEKSLSFLSTGVETLKLIASNLESLEKINEVHD